MRACAREEIDVRAPFEELPKADQDFVINGEARDEDTDVEELAENDRWYGVRGFFKWLESKTYKMHVRVLLSRYRAYTTCPDCNGGRFQPDALNYRIVSPRRENGDARRLRETLAGSGAAFDQRRAQAFRRSRLAARRLDRRDAAERSGRAAALSLRSRARLSHARSLDPHAQRRRSAAGESHDLPRRVARQHALRHGRTERGPASARRRPARPRDARSAGQGKHAARRRARGSHHPRRPIT